MLKNILKPALVLLMLISNMAMSAQPIETSVWQSENGSFQLSYQSQLNPIVINQIHSWTLHLTNAEGEAINDALISVKGGMPEHNHGLATAPSIKPEGNGNYLLQGLRFHMMGYWELELNISDGDNNDIVIVTLNL